MMSNSLELAPRPKTNISIGIRGAAIFTTSKKCKKVGVFLTISIWGVQLATLQLLHYTVIITVHCHFHTYEIQHDSHCQIHSFVTKRHLGITFH